MVRTNSTLMLSSSSSRHDEDDGNFPPRTVVLAETIEEARNILRENEVTVLKFVGSATLGDAGAWAIAKALSPNTSLQELHLDYSAIGDIGVKALLEALERHDQLHKLSLEGNRIRQEGATALAQAISCSCLLTELNMRENPLEYQGIKMLVEAVEECNKKSPSCSFQLQLGTSLHTPTTEQGNVSCIASHHRAKKADLGKESSSDLRNDPFVKKYGCIFLPTPTTPVGLVCWILFVFGITIAMSSLIPTTLRRNACPGQQITYLPHCHAAEDEITWDVSSEKIDHASNQDEAADTTTQTAPVAPSPLTEMVVAGSISSLRNQDSTEISSEQTHSFLKVLSSMAEQSSSDRMAIIRSGGVPVIVKVLKENKRHSGIQQEGHRALHYLSLVENNKQDQHSTSKHLEAIASILRTMQQHVAVEPIQEEGCRTLRNMAFHDANARVLVASAGGITVILKALKLHGHVPDIQEQCGAALGNLVLGNDNNKITIAAAGGAEVILEGMQQHPKVAEIQEQACATLHLLSNIDHDRTKAGIEEAGAVSVLIHTMQEHWQQASVQEHACAALCNLAFRNFHRKQAIADAGGVDAIAKAMRAHLGLANVQEKCIASLCQLAAQEEISIAIAAEAGGVDLILKAMEKHPHGKGVQAEGCAALYMLGFHNDDILDRIIKAGGHGIMKNIVVNHPSLMGVDYTCDDLRRWLEKMSSFSDSSEHISD